jgi:hypothetical protein
MRLINHCNETFELRILGKVVDSSGKPVDWWFRSCVIISESGKKRKTNLKFLTIEDLELLRIWIQDIYNGQFEKTLFQFVDGHVWFRLWKRGSERFIRFFIQGDKYRKFYWDWRLTKDVDRKLLNYTNYLLNTTKIC